MKTNKILIAICVLILGFNMRVVAQESNQCGQQQIMDNWFKLHPEDKTIFEASQKAISLNENQHKTYQSTSSSANYTIPVVFHILHKGGPENISDAQVLDQINILNRDYQKQNADTITVVSSYTNNIAKVNFAFTLASIDPNGNCTNGIIRHYDLNSNSWPLSVGNFSQYAYTWPSNKYLNIYVVGNIIGLDGAYAILPGTPIPLAADVIVTEHYVTGSIGTANVANSRVLTHEVGHWFNLLHTWGSSNQPGVACGDDNVTDTPITKGFTVCNTVNTDICNPGIFENVQNYMDYSPCKRMFTNGQAARMLATINGTVNGRNNLSSPSNLLATGVTSSTPNCIPLVEVAVASTKTVCIGSSITVLSYTSNANTTSYSWTANNGAVVANSTSANATVLLTNVGNSTVICTAINANGSDTAIIVLTGVNNNVQITTTNAQGFEASSLPVDWTVLNATTPSSLWSITNASASEGSQSMFVNGESASGGAEEILQTPAYDFLNNQGSVFSFKYAYARHTSTHNDLFKVQASKDCGGSWSDLYVPSMQALANGSGGVSSAVFIPTTAQWKYYDISQVPNFVNFVNENNVIFRFYFKEDAVGFGNRIYLDEINFISPVGINEFTKSISLRVYPIPTKSSIEVNFNLSVSANIKYSLTNTAGIELIESNEVRYDEGNISFAITGLSSIKSGIYFLNLTVNGINTVKKIVIE